MKSSNGPKQQIFSHLAEIAAALAHPHRIEILELIAQGERSVEDLAERIGLSLSNTSRHLQVLRRARLAAPRREGKNMFYSLVSETEVVTLLASLGRVGERNIAEIDQVLQSYFRTRDSLEPVSRSALLERLRDGSVTLLDVRPPEEFARGHLPGALNISLDQLDAALGDFTENIPVVAYCRGPYCVLSYDAVAQLRARGVQATRLEDGYPEWKAAGLPVET
ncbi:ArsR/SmtB family transcription factor [Acidocella aminolytica]|uniref:Transcriptional regulator ArsR n=1 Tax=Acidocella aminolytica 101 = DSM 11237 TaxID=1120923 RepID=A0A0D6PCK6_9PROT|nr:metalloregulator ArsR/SmtB family transcription factor [Acidocella aminolytica]GAN78589.1 transcriptional regulator ArsR [Acidocella aminolytica 101 = DSM 11237]GBQ34162.1 ArsR family transcriptional regulator [Acidocella aminolytica 101 = DSM 11237]SHF24072.1 transcriptional regulator, ArsR family [Acidocella aminolytica 101 = DSM 11237]